MTVFDPIKSAKNDFTQSQSDRKMAKFPHCETSTVKILNQAAQVCTICKFLKFVPKFGKKLAKVDNTASHLS